jgi:hypothetical protein
VLARRESVCGAAARADLLVFEKGRPFQAKVSNTQEETRLRSSLSEAAAWRDETAPSGTSVRKCTLLAQLA